MYIYTCINIEIKGGLNQRLIEDDSAGTPCFNLGLAAGPAQKKVNGFRPRRCFLPRISLLLNLVQLFFAFELQNFRNFGCRFPWGISGPEGTEQILKTVGMAGYVLATYLDTLL